METQTINNENKKAICHFCKSENTIKWTTRKTENRGIIQRYKCKDCGKYFTLDDGFFRMRNSPQKITQAVRLILSWSFNKRNTRAFRYVLSS